MRREKITQQGQKKTRAFSCHKHTQTEFAATDRRKTDRNPSIVSNILLDVSTKISVTYLNKQSIFDIFGGKINLIF
jgi:hypothetical protein